MQLPKTPALIQHVGRQLELGNADAHLLAVAAFLITGPMPDGFSRALSVEGLPQYTDARCLLMPTPARAPATCAGIMCPTACTPRFAAEPLRCSIHAAAAVPSRCSTL